MSAAATRARVIVPAGGITVAAQIKHAHVTVSRAGAVHLHLVLEGNVYARKPYGSGSAAQFVVATLDSSSLLLLRRLPRLTSNAFTVSPPRRGALPHVVQRLDLLGAQAALEVERTARELMRTRPVVTISAAGWAIDDIISAAGWAIDDIISAAGWAIDDIDQDRLVLVDVLHLDWPRPADYTEAAQGPDGAKA